MSTASCERFPVIFSILIEGPGWNDSEFYGKWLLAAAYAQRLWTEAIESDREFRAQIERLELVGRVQFGTDAFKLIGKLAEEVRTLIVHADSDLGDSVAMMALMGFFVLTGERYQMALPTHLTSASVRAAGVKLAETEDAEYEIHPEYLVRTMPLAAAKSWQRRLQKMDEGHRLADRRLLMECAQVASPD